MCCAEQGNASPAPKSSLKFPLERPILSQSLRQGWGSPGFMEDVRWKRVGCVGERRATPEAAPAISPIHVRVFPGVN